MKKVLASALAATMVLTAAPVTGINVLAEEDASDTVVTFTGTGSGRSGTRSGNTQKSL